MRKFIKQGLAGSLAIVVAFSGLTFMAPKATETVSAAGEYQLVWSDEFNGTELDRTIWNVEVNGNGGGNNEHQYYLDSSENIEVSDGTLKITALKKSYGGKSYTSGRINSNGKYTFKYGKIEARMKLPCFQGIWPAFWTLGANYNKVGWPKCGEMDIMEAINSENQVYANLHWSYNGNQADTQGGNAGIVSDRTQWHVYGMEWTEDSASFYVDGKVFQTYDISKSAQMDVAFNKEQFIIFNLAVGGTWPGHTIDDTKFPTTMEVDYVRLYQTPEQQPTTTPEYTGPYVTVTEDAVAVSDADWTSWFGGSSWQGSTGTLTANGTSPSNGVTVNLTSVGTNVGGDSIWGAQAQLLDLHYYKGGEYTYKCTLLSDVDKRVYVKVADGDESNLAGEIITLKAGVPYNYTAKFTLEDDFDSTVSLKFGMGKADGDTIADNGKATIKITDVSLTTTTQIPDPDYVNPTTTQAQTTTEKVTTQAVTTTKKPAVKAPAQVKIAKIYPKKKSAKKITIKLTKKITGVTGYSVRVYRTKKNARNNKNVFIKYTMKGNKIKITLTNRRLKNKKTLYVRVRAYKKVNGKNIYSNKWSNIVKVKVK